MIEFPYTWTWKTRLAERRGQRLRCLTRGKSMNSCLVEFEDGSQFVTSRNALRKSKP